MADEEGKVRLLLDEELAGGGAVYQEAFKGTDEETGLACPPTAKPTYPRLRRISVLVGLGCVLAIGLWTARVPREEEIKNSTRFQKEKHVHNDQVPGGDIMSMPAKTVDIHEIVSFAEAGTPDLCKVENIPKKSLSANISYIQEFTVPLLVSGSPGNHRWLEVHTSKDIYTFNSELYPSFTILGYPVVGIPVPGLARTQISVKPKIDEGNFLTGPGRKNTEPCKLRHPKTVSEFIAFVCTKAGGTYDILGNNCQKFTTDVLKEFTTCSSNPQTNNPLAEKFYLGCSYVSGLAIFMGIIAMLCHCARTVDMATVMTRATGLLASQGDNVGDAVQSCVPLVITIVGALITSNFGLYYCLSWWPKFIAGFAESGNWPLALFMGVVLPCAALVALLLFGRQAAQEYEKVTQDIIRDLYAGPAVGYLVSMAWSVPYEVLLEVDRKGIAGEEGKQEPLRGSHEWKMLRESIGFYKKEGSKINGKPVYKREGDFDNRYLLSMKGDWRSDWQSGSDEPPSRHPDYWVITCEKEYLRLYNRTGDRDNGTIFAQGGGEEPDEPGKPWCHPELQKDMKGVALFQVYGYSKGVHCTSSNTREGDVLLNDNNDLKICPPNNPDFGFGKHHAKLRPHALRFQVGDLLVKSGKNHETRKFYRIANMGLEKGVMRCQLKLESKDEFLDKAVSRLPFALTWLGPKLATGDRVLNVLDRHEVPGTPGIIEANFVKDRQLVLVHEERATWPLDDSGSWQWLEEESWQERSKSLIITFGRRYGSTVDRSFKTSPVGLIPDYFDRCTVNKVNAGTPAEKEGVQEGWEILEMDGEYLKPRWKMSKWFGSEWHLDPASRKNEPRIGFVQVVLDD
eukprot:TRINITY_DN28672_c0_g1_i1.p1 TRINITY_DN28672_c0_g1~~TRINITY_DN28672_c0_g1_i1.p1  ORF type:complete len:851 (-),score=124.15 TRINITY_DN28672_c0_g1_i1:112-2664(-)